MRMSSRSQMFWWDWAGRRKVGALAIILVCAAVPWLLLGWLPSEPGAFLGGTAFLAILQMIALFLIVGAKTGKLPMAYGGTASRAEKPIEFWCACAAYASVLLLALSFIAFVLFDTR